MKIEHAAWTVEDPVACAEWYVAHLGMKVLRGSDSGSRAQFMADGTGRILLEIYNNPRVPCPDYRNADPLLIHLAFAVDDVAAEVDRLVAAGAAVHSPYAKMDNGDEMAMLRDPWGFPVQILKRGQPM